VLFEPGEIMRRTSITLIVLLISLVCYPALHARAQSAKDILRASKLKAKVESLGFKTPVIVELVDGSTLKRPIADIAADAFSVTDRKTGVATLVAFKEVKDVHKKPSQGMVVAAIAGSAGAAVGLLYLTTFALSKCAPCMGP